MRRVKEKIELACIDDDNQTIQRVDCRAPELLFVMPEHSTAVDMWAVACIFAEMILRRELFPGRSVGGQIKLMIGQLGSPPEEVSWFRLSLFSKA